MYFDVNGKQVFASTGGKPFDNGKPVVMFLHGSGFDHTVWNLQSRFFAFRDYAVLALDLPGHTNSEGPALESIEAMADWLHDVVEVLDCKDISPLRNVRYSLPVTSRSMIRSSSFGLVLGITGTNPSGIESCGISLTHVMPLPVNRTR